nr:MAG TPA: hypothetical protein [Caudoviricetes sp.]
MALSPTPPYTLVNTSVAVILIVPLYERGKVNWVI